VQLVGWTIFELVIMGHAANAVSRRALGWDAYWFWLALFTLIVIGLGVWGPLAVVRRFLSQFAVWIMLATTVYITWLLLARHDVGAIWARPGTGGFPGFWTAVDIVIAMPISWMPLVGDYSRFGRKPGPAALGTALGYLVANIWFYALGALILLATNVTQEPKGFVESIMLLAGPLALLILLVDEPDEAWADVYSCAVSLQNIRPSANQRSLVLGVGGLAFLVALVLDITKYESFLLLIGGAFVPLFGVLACDFFILRRRYDPTEILAATAAGVHWSAIGAWLIGAATYYWIAGHFAPLGLAGVPDMGASIPAFIVAIVAHAVLDWVARSRQLAWGS
jgi:putative hydroxymethylpyrimidine transporter CytX